MGLPMVVFGEPAKTMRGCADSTQLNNDAS
jgi:hypothetical protein